MPAIPAELDVGEYPVERGVACLGGVIATSGYELHCNNQAAESRDGSLGIRDSWHSRHERLISDHVIALVRLCLRDFECLV